jgi:hypothetical protein
MSGVLPMASMTSLRMDMIWKDPEAAMSGDEDE